MDVLGNGLIIDAVLLYHKLLVWVNMSLLIFVFLDVHICLIDHIIFRFKFLILGKMNITIY